MTEADASSHRGSGGTSGVTGDHVDRDARGGADQRADDGAGHGTGSGTDPDARLGSLGLSRAQLAQAGEFDDPKHELCRLLAELFGTFLLVLVAAGAGVIDTATSGGIGRAASVTAPGLMVMVVILFLGSNSGAHINPVVTVAFALRRDFPWRRVPAYILAQLLGASLAAGVLRLAFGAQHGLGATKPDPGFTDLQALIIETLLTLGLVATILGAASGAQNIGPLSALAVGAYVVLAGLWASPVSGASMNPARSFGPDLLLGDFTRMWIYLAGPVAGMLLAVGLARLLHGFGGSQAESKTAQGEGAGGGG